MNGSSAPVFSADLIGLTVGHSVGANLRSIAQPLRAWVRLNPEGADRLFEEQGFPGAVMKKDGEMVAGRTLVTLGTKCPQLLLEVHEAIQVVKAGETLEVIADDPEFKLDIEAWCRHTGNELLELRTEGDRYIATIRRSFECGC